MADTKPDELLSIRDVMRVLKVARETPYRWHQRGVLRAVVLPGNTLRWRRSDIDALIASGLRGEGVAP